MRRIGKERELRLRNVGNRGVVGKSQAAAVWAMSLALDALIAAGSAAPAPVWEVRRLLFVLCPRV